MKVPRTFVPGRGAVASFGRLSFKSSVCREGAGRGSAMSRMFKKATAVRIQTVGDRINYRCQHISARGR